MASCSLVGGTNGSSQNIASIFNVCINISEEYSTSTFMVRGYQCFTGTHCLPPLDMWTPIFRRQVLPTLQSSFSSEKNAKDKKSLILFPSFIFPPFPSLHAFLPSYRGTSEVTGTHQPNHSSVSQPARPQYETSPLFNFKNQFYTILFFSRCSHPWFMRRPSLHQ